MTCEYIFSGTLPEDASTYVKRKADDELFKGIKAGKFCYVLNSRQTGKSSLRVQVMRRLKQEGFACAFIDLSISGTQQTPEQWYAGMLRSLTKDLGLKVNLRRWWREQDWLSPLERFRDFIELEMLVQKTENIVIFIDEIDSVLSLDFPTDDFFAFIRACHNQRVDTREYNRLSFCLLGVATPSDLIQDKKRTPFNIGQAISLNGFQSHEVQPLAEGLKGKVGHPQALLEEVLAWTGGQPFLTQKLCKLIVSSEASIREGGEKEWVEDLVRSQVIEKWESQDEPEHLRTIRDRILSSKNEECLGRLLEIYQQILHDKVRINDSPEQMELRLSGLVVKQQDKLRVYNQIYKSVFNQVWIDDILRNWRPYHEEISAWLKSNYKNDSYLLRGDKLTKVRIWSIDKNLSTEDRRFLFWSQIEEEKETLEFNQSLRWAKQKAERKSTIVANIFGALLVLTGAVAIVSFGHNKMQKEISEATRIEKEGADALLNYMLYTREETLLTAMQAGQDLQTLVKNGRPLQEYPATSPILALQSILSKINQRTQLYSVNDVSFSPDGQHFATAKESGTVQIWDLSGKQLVRLKGHQGSVISVSFSPDGQRVGTVGEDYTARIWDLSGQQLTKFSFERDKVYINHVRFSPNLENLVGVAEYRTIRIWNLQGKQLAQWRPAATGIPGFSPDGKRLATLGEKDNTIRLWDLSGKLLAEWIIKPDELGRVMFSPDGQHIATTGWSGAVGIWDLSGKQLVQWKVEPFTIESVSFSPDGQHIVGISNKDTVKLWSSKGKILTEIKRQPGDFKTVAFSPDGEHLATGGYNGAVSIWNLSGKRVTKISKGQQSALDRITLNSPSYEVEKVTFSPDSQHIATIEDRGVRLWKRSGQQIAQLTSSQGEIEQVKFSRDGEYIATVTTVSEPMDLTVESLGSTTAENKIPNSVVQIWNLSGQPLVQLKGHQGNVLSVKFSPDGKRIVTRLEDGTVKLWNLLGRQLDEIQGKNKIDDVSFSLDDYRLITIGEEGTIRLQDLQGKNPNVKLSYVSFSPDGQSIVTAEENGTIHIWDLSGRKISEFKSDQNNVTEIIWSSNGQRIALIDSNAGYFRSDRAQIWDISGRQIGLFEDFKGFSPDGQYVATRRGYGVTEIQRIRGLDELLAEGCYWLRGYFATNPEAQKRLHVCQKK